MRKLMLLLAVALCLVTSGCVVGQKINHSYMPKAGTLIEGSDSLSMSISVVDNRPYILSGSKQACFIGIYKSGFGIPYDVKTDGEVPLAERLKRDLTADLKSAGFIITDKDIEREIVVSIQEYNFNCYMNCRVWHSLIVQIKDTNENILHSREIVLDLDVAGGGFGGKYAMEKEMPKIYAKMIQDIVRNDAGAMAALKRQN